ncbi:MAG: hypothetical protein E7000_01140 [Coriobacteriaceae bacterium]|nr:hypothetical protein [Coriobacteriaceae bacterium]
MPEMPEFVVQAELATGLPWWCLLVIAALVLVVLILAISLGREKRHNRIGNVDIPRGGAAAVAAEDKADDADAEPAADDDVSDEASAREDTFEEPEVEAGDVDADQADEEPADAPDDAAESPEPPAEDEQAVDAGEGSEAGEPLEQEEPVEASSDASPAQASEQADGNAASEFPDVEVVEKAARAAVNPAVSDDEIFKAVAGSHSRRGQSAFGIDFGFLEEYEEEYERALEEFRRLRTDLDGTGAPR